MSYCKVSFCRHSSEHTTCGHQCGKCFKYGHGQSECGHPQKMSVLLLYKDVLPQHLQCTKSYCKFKQYHTSATHRCRCKQFHDWNNCEKNPEYIKRREEEKKLSFDTTIECPICRTKNSVSFTDHKVFGLENTCSICMENKVDIILPVCKHAVICKECISEMKDDTTESQPQFYGSVYPDDPDINEKINVIFINRCRGMDGKIAICLNAGMGCTWYVRRDRIGELVEYKFVHSQDGYSDDVSTSNDKFIEGYKII